MKDTKRRMMTFTFYDRTGIERDLEEQAAKGWMLEKCAATGWIYRRIEPAKIHFAVTYFPGADAYDPAPSEKQLRFQEFCQHTGWELVASNVQLQIFCNRAENPIPIETDPVIEVENIHASVKKALLRPQITNLFLALVQLLLCYSRFSSEPVPFVARSFDLMLIATWMMIMISSAGQLLFYYSWFFRARKAARDGLFLETRSIDRFQIIIMVLMILGIGLSLVATRNTELGWSFLLTIVGLLGAVALVVSISNMMKEKGVSAITNQITTTLLTVILSFALIIFVTVSTIGTDRNDDAEKYTVGNRTTYIYHDTLPLTIEQLMETDYENYSYRIWVESSSPLLGWFQGEQSPMMDAPEEPGLSYTIVEVKVASLYDWTVEQMIEDIRRDYRFYSSVDPAPWGAEQVYQLLVNDEVRDRYLLCYENRIVEIELSWTPTAEQMATVGQILGTQ